MDFFAQQDQARRNTTWLVILFLLAVVSLVLVTNLLVTLTLWSLGGGSADLLASMSGQQLLALFSWERSGLVALAVTGTVFCAILYKRFQLAEGGKRIAESLGGRRIAPNSDDPDEIRVLNVVEEMAIASGMPVPPVYLLGDETGINAFAAGNSPSDAVIGVTRGCIEQFDRPQLQGVIAHEFSHILNGDMRLNLRLISLLYGIIFIGNVGEILLRSSGHSRSSHRAGNKRSGGQLILLGLGLLAIGWLGAFFGKLIKSAVSRQREFLADASAVQFTRNPQGITDALKVIGGYSAGTEVNNLNAGEMSHLFFGQSLRSLSGLFATHPPLIDRIIRIEPGWDGSYIRRQPKPRPAAEHTAEKAQQRGQKLNQVLDAAILGTLASGHARPSHDDATPAALSVGPDSLPQRLREHARDPLGAVALVYTLLLSDDDTIRNRQLAALNGLKIEGLGDYCQRLRPQLQALAVALRLPLIELCLPALKCMSPQQYPTFKKGMMILINADQQIDLFEWCLYQLVRHYLAPEHEQPKPPKNRYSQPQQVAQEYQLVLSMLAHHGQQNAEETERAFQRGASCANLYNLSLLPLAACNRDAFIKAVNKLADCQPILKPRLIKGLERCAKQDGSVNALERELVTSIAAVMDSPVPNWSAANP